MDEVVKYLKALVALQANSILSEDCAVRLEILLARAGLKHAEIAEIIGKSPAAVAKTLSRAR